MALAMKDCSMRFIESCVDTLKVPKVSDAFDITGKSAAHVIAIFKLIVNNRKGQYKFSKEKAFTFNIGKPPAFISFKLKAKPTDDQPGNGVFRVRRNHVKKRKCHKYDEELVKELTKWYPNTKVFAEEIQRFFKDNSDLPQSGNEIIQDVYILLLFEVGRRLVKDSEEHTDRKKALDNLPMSQAITTIVKLFEQEECRFEDVFLIRGKFHCFTARSPKKRKEAIEQLECKNITALFYREEDQESSEDSTSESKGLSESDEEEDTSIESELSEDTSSEIELPEDTSSESEELPCEDDTSQFSIYSVSTVSSESAGYSAHSVSTSEKFSKHSVSSKSAGYSTHSVSESEGFSKDAEAKFKNLPKRMPKSRKYKLVKETRKEDRKLSDTDRQ